MDLLINKKVNVKTSTKKGVTSVAKRIWLEGRRLLNIIPIGAKMHIQDSADGIVIEFNREDGTRIVSQRNEKGTIVPLVEINESNSEFLKSISTDTILRFAITSKGIRITPNMQVVEKRVEERETRILKKLAAGTKLEKGSIFAGGGTLDYMGHKGFEKSGLGVVVRLAIDYETGAIDNLIRNCSHVFDDKSVIIESDISLLNIDNRMPLLDMLTLTPPCVDASAAGKAKKGNTEETSKTAHLIYYYSQIIDKTNPAVILIENVAGFAKEASFLVLKGLLDNWGYDLQMRVIESNKEGFSLENRKRMYAVAISKGISDVFDINDVKPLREPAQTMSEILDTTIPTDSKCWTPKTGLIEKQERDIAKGNGFMMQLISPEDTKCPVLRAGYQKSGSSDALFPNPDVNNKTFRILTAQEHALAKTIDVDFIKGCTQGQAHRILGNGLIGSVAEAICYELGTALKKLVVVNPDMMHLKAA